MLLRLLAHEEGGQRLAALRAQRRQRAGERHRAHLEPADHVDAPHPWLLQRLEQEGRGQQRPLGVEHGGLEVEVEVALAPRRELDLAAAEGAHADDLGEPRAGGGGGRRGLGHQCASSQLSAARASTCSGTESDTAGSGASVITLATTGKVLATSLVGTSNTSSSCTCNSILALSLASASAPSMRTMARRMMSAAVPCSRALIAARSMNARMDGFDDLISG